MKKRTLLTVLLLAATTLFMPAQNKLTLQSALNNYMPEGMRNIIPMKDGETYTQLSNDGKKILRCSFKTGKVVSSFLMPQRHAEMQRYKALTLHTLAR